MRHWIIIPGAVLSYRIKVVAPHYPKEIGQEVEDLLENLEKIASPWREESWISQFNRAGAGTRHQVPELLWPLIEEALSLAEESGGYFDPTMGALVELWGFGPHRKNWSGEPSPQAVRDALEDCGFEKLIVDRIRKRLGKQRPGLMLDFAGIAKGYAVDKMVTKILELDYEDFIVEFGGEVGAAGSAPGKVGWAVRLPGDRGFLTLVNESVATSGATYQNRGTYSHLIDPETGYPTGISAPVTIHARSCARADALATAAAVMGDQKRVKKKTQENDLTLEGQTLHSTLKRG